MKWYVGICGGNLISVWVHIGLRRRNRARLAHKLTWNVYTDGIVLSECVFCIRNTSSRSSPFVGNALMEVLERSLKEETEWANSQSIFCMK